MKHHQIPCHATGVLSARADGDKRRQRSRYIALLAGDSRVACRAAVIATVLKEEAPRQEAAALFIGKHEANFIGVCSYSDNAFELVPNDKQSVRKVPSDDGS